MAAAVRLMNRMKINPRFNPNDKKKCLGPYGGCYLTYTNPEVIERNLIFFQKKGLFLLL